MFPLKNKKTTGFAYGQKTWYTAHHLGQDYAAKIGDKLYAPFDGEILKNFTGTQGGLTVWFKPDHDNVIMRFMHNSAYKGKVGKVKEGDLMALTGNTGSATTGAHSHIDISRKQVILTDWRNFIDPEKYQWESSVNHIPDVSNMVADNLPEPPQGALDVLSEAVGISQPEMNKIVSQDTPDITKIENYNLPLDVNQQALDEAEKKQLPIWIQILINLFIKLWK